MSGTMADLAERQAELRPYVSLAREAILAHLEGRRPRAPLDLNPVPSQGVFVTLHRRADHSLRGCIGHMSPTRANLDDEVASCAVSAASQDPRFLPVERDEVDGLDIELSLLEEEEPVASFADLDPAVFGVVVRADGRTGVLLPDIEGVDSVEQQVGIALRKAGIPPGMPYALTRFRVTKVKERGPQRGG